MQLLILVTRDLDFLTNDLIVKLLTLLTSGRGEGGITAPFLAPCCSASVSLHSKGKALQTPLGNH